MKIKMTHLSRNDPTERWQIHCQKRAFLLVEAFAGAALVVIALSLTLWVMKKDQDLRKRAEMKMDLLIRSENLLERCSNLPYERITDQILAQEFEQSRKALEKRGLLMEFDLNAISAEPSHQRVTVTAKDTSGQVIVRLWRNFYPETKRP